MTRSGHLDRHAERARRLVRAVFEIELDVLLRVQVDAEVARASPRARAPSASFGNAESQVTPRQTRVDVPALDLAEPDADAAAEEAVAGVLPEPLGRVEEAPALVGEVVERILEAAR